MGRSSKASPSSASTSYLDQIVKKDMVRTGTWMDLRVDAQNIVIEMTEAVLQELLEDTILCCIDESLETVDVSI